MADEIIEKIGRIIATPPAQLEIELRFIVDQRKKEEVYSPTYTPEQSESIAKQLIEKYKDKPSSISQTINLIAEDAIKQLVFINGEQDKSRAAYYSKTKIVKPMIFLHNNLPAYKLNASFETPIEEFSVSKATLARIKLRYSIELGDWQLDITLVKSVVDLSNPIALKTARNAMIYAIDVKNFVEKAPWGGCELIEFELEFKGKEFSSDSLIAANEIFDFLNKSDTKDETAALPSNKEYQAAIYEVAKLIKPHEAQKFKQSEGLKQLSNQVIELDKNMFLSEVLSQITNFYMTDKIDGTRTLLYIAGGTCYAISKDLHTFAVDTEDTYVMDSESYEDKYYLFDVLVYKNKNITNLDFTTRMKHFADCAKLHPSFETKPFERLTDDFQTQLRKFKARKPHYETDGVILTPSAGDYLSMRVYKYKPIDRLSIDFVVKKCPDKLLGVEPYIKKPGKVLYLLFSGMRADMFRQLRLKFVDHYHEIFPGIDTKNPPKYFPYQFQPSNFQFAYLYWGDRDDLDGEVGEFVCAPCVSKTAYKATDDIWKLQKTRDDRKGDLARGNYYGNYFKVAELTWMSYNEPLVIEDLKELTNYFQEHDNPLQKATRSFNSFVKSEIFEQFADSEWCMDMASGKGQDLFRYSTYNFRNLVFLEIDNVALLELIKRKHEMKNTNPMSIQIHQMDMLDPYQDNIAKLSDIRIPADGVDIIICNFAFHYFLENKKTLANVAKFVSNYLKPGGRFVFTTFDGKDVLKLLNENKGEWTVKSSDKIKYSIKRQYSTSILESVGQRIDVMLPFSQDKYYTEYLVNIDYIAEVFEKLQMTLEIDQSFGEFLSIYATKNKNGFAYLDDNDKKYSSLYHYYCFYKKKTSGGR